MHLTSFKPFRCFLIECITIWYLLAFSLCQETDDEPKTALSVKSKKQMSRKPPGRQADDFKTLMSMNSAFIDKSILIKEILQHDDRVIVITRPRKWGKSTNLQMLRLFLLQELDENDYVKPPHTVKEYHLFTKGEISTPGERGSEQLKSPLLISREKDLVKEYLCQYPVIHVRFTYLRGHNFDSLCRQMQRQIRTAFGEHRYMTDVFNRVIFDNTSTNCQKAKMEKHVNLFRKFVANEKTDLHKQIRCLEFLSRILSEYFHKPVFLLIDDYDAPVRLAILNETFIASDKPKFFTFYEKFIRYSVLTNRFIKKAVLTGIMNLHHLENYTHTMNDVQDPFYEFYGFTEHERKLLFDHYGITKDYKAKALDRYQAFSNTSQRLYNPWSIHNFLYEKKIRNFWLEEDGHVSYIKPLLKNAEFRQAFTRLVYNNELFIDQKNLHLNIDDYMHLQNFMRERIKDNITHSAISFLHTHGYIVSTKLNNATILLQFPNNEISMEMRNELVRYYRAKLGISDANKIKKEIDLFKKFIKKEHRNGVVLGEIIKKLLNFRPRRLDESKIHAILNFLAVYVDSYKKIQIEVSNDSLPDLMFIKYNRCVIIKFSIKASSPKKAWYKATTYRHMVPSNNTKLLFIGINVPSNKIVQVRMDVLRPSDNMNISSEEPSSAEEPSNVQTRYTKHEKHASDEDGSASDGDEPASDEDEPASDGDEPVSDGDEPASDEDEPVSDEDELADDEDEPVSDEDEEEDATGDQDTSNLQPADNKEHISNEEHTDDEDEHSTNESS